MSSDVYIESLDSSDARNTENTCLLQIEVQKDNFESQWDPSLEEIIHLEAKVMIVSRIVQRTSNCSVAFNGFLSIWYLKICSVKP